MVLVLVSSLHAKSSAVKRAEILFYSHLSHRHLLHRSRWLRRVLLSVGKSFFQTIIDK